MRTRALARGLATCTLAAAPLSAQNVVRDQGVFAVTVNGRPAGTEEFAIRQSGAGSDGTVIANGRVTLQLPGGPRPIQVVLSTDPRAGSARRYQVEVGGALSMDLRLRLVGRRYVSIMRTPEGQEEREFPARPDTRILETEIAHHYYFLRNVREGTTVPVIEPRTRRRLQLRATESVEEEIRVGPISLEARRTVFEADGERRIVWYDRQGRVVRVEIPEAGYVAERTDLVG